MKEHPACPHQSRSFARLFVTPALAVLVLGVLGACSGKTTAGTAPSTPAASQQAAATTVQIVADPNTIGAYSPPTVTVSAGQTVKWVFEGPIPHTVTADDNSFSSGGVADGFANGQTYTHTFATAGSYPYHCAIHPQMHGTVVVQ
ncbi:MAG TPA: plastocyanin/azurin family copper-binding protein [Actinomycetota bacterium]|nr:plastocyanin/azurin family copper-binding protein [Actinomycetota bacterium]